MRSYMYLGEACDFINDSLKAVVSVPPDSVTTDVDMIAEFYGPGLYFARNLPDGERLIFRLRIKNEKSKDSLRKSRQIRN
jgi:hypothetical protein